MSSSDEDECPPPLGDLCADPCSSPVTSVSIVQVHLEETWRSLMDCPLESLTAKMDEVLTETLQSHSVTMLEEVCEVLLLSLSPDRSTMEACRNYVSALPNLLRSKCRCDAQWYAKEGVEHIAFGCKTCALSSASCICVKCFEAGDHEGHDFYISRSDYGCCDCGDIYAWKSSGFCSSHTGPTVADPPLHPITKQCSESILRVIVCKISSSEYFFNFLKRMASLHDGIRRLVGRHMHSVADTLLVQSVDFAAEARQAWAKLIVDLMLDFEFKKEFSKTFAKHYKELVLQRVGGNMSDLGDFTCQMLTRPDVASDLTVGTRHDSTHACRTKRDTTIHDACTPNLITTIWETIDEILEMAECSFDPETVDTAPAHGSTRSLIETFVRAVMEGSEAMAMDEGLEPFSVQDYRPVSVSTGYRIVDHSHPVIKQFATVQSSMDLTYLLDHPDVCAVVANSDEYWSGFLKTMGKLQNLNPHRKRTDQHVQFPDLEWSNSLQLIGDLFSTFWLVLPQIRDFQIILSLANDFLKTRQIPPTIRSLHCPLSRVIGLLLSESAVRVGDAPPADMQFVSAPLAAFEFHSQVVLGEWVRNGDSVRMECELYKSACFHHHLGSADLACFRMAWILHGDEFLSRVLSCDRIAGLQLFVYLLSQQSEWSLDYPHLIRQRAIDLLAVSDRTFSQLRDPFMERWTHTLMPTHNAALEAALAPFAQPGTANYKIPNNASDWFSVDLVSPFWGSWKDLQRGEQRVIEQAGSVKKWWAMNRAQQPRMYEQFVSKFETLISSPVIVAHICLTLAHLVENPDDFRSLKLVVHLILRLCYEVGPSWQKCCGVGSAVHSRIACEDPINLSTLTIAFAPVLCSVGRCTHPWTVQINDHSSSILQMLQILKNREVSNEMKQWLDLVVETVSDQCTHTRGSNVSPLAKQPVARSKTLQQQLLARQAKKQSKFLTKVDHITETPAHENTGMCVVCLSDDPVDLHYLGYSVSSAFDVFTFPPNPQKVHIITRACGHKLHTHCYQSLQTESNLFRSRQIVLCPYCSRPANFLFPPPDDILNRFLCNIDQLALSLRKPSCESDANSLILATRLMGKPAVMPESPPVGARAELFRSHIIAHLFGDHPLPFDEIVSIDSLICVEDEVTLLANALTPQIELPSDLVIPNSLDPHILQRDGLKTTQSGAAEFWPTIVASLAPVYQKIFTQYLSSSKCTKCSEQRSELLCLLCGLHSCSPCYVRHACSRGGFGVYMHIPSSFVYIVDGSMFAKWGSLYLDSHGEEDPTLSKPLTLSLEQVDRLRNEIREQSWVWKHGSKKLAWKPFFS